jgi:hypothetical protein
MDGTGSMSVLVRCIDPHPIDAYQCDYCTYYIIDAPSLTFFFVVLQAVAFVTFLVGFITVLCIGNYFRAKRAQERQRQRRLAKLAANNGGYGADGQGSYEAPAHLPVEGVHA